MEILVLTDFFVIGACIGSFINALNYRYIKGRSMLGRSECPRCGHKLTPVELIPIISYLLQSGKCKKCKKTISPRYPLVESVTASAFLFVGAFFWPSLQSLDVFVTVPKLLFFLFSVSALIAIAAADISWGIIPDFIVFPSIALTVVYRIYEVAFRDLRAYFALQHDAGIGKYLLPPYSDYFTNIVKADLYLLLWALLIGLGIAGFFYLLIYFTRGRAMGLGDVKLGFLLGLLVGWPAGLVSVFLAFLTGALASVMLILVHKKRFGGTVPFGPFLSLGAFLGLFYGQQLIDYYLRVMR